MKRQVSTGYVFTPASAKLDLSGVAGLSSGGLLAVLDVTTGGIVYAVATPGLGASFAGLVLTLAAPMTGMAPTDVLTVIYDDGTAAAQDGADATGIAPPAGGSGIRGWLSGIYGRLVTLASTVAAGAIRTAIQSNAPRVSATGALGAANAAVPLALDGMSAVVVQLTGTWVGTVAWQASVDGGATYFAVNMIPYGGGAPVGSAAGNGQWEMACGGLTHLQAVMTVSTSGTATALLAASNGIKSVRVGNPAGNPLTTADLNGAAFASASVMTAGTSTAAGRSVGIVCTAAGNLVLTLAGGGSITLPIAPGWQTFPFAATAFALSGSGAGTVYNLN